MEGCDRPGERTAETLVDVFVCVCGWLEWEWNGSGGGGKRLEWGKEGRWVGDGGGGVSVVVEERRAPIGESWFKKNPPALGRQSACFDSPRSMIEW